MRLHTRRQAQTQQLRRCRRTAYLALITTLCIALYYFWPNSPATSVNSSSSSKEEAAIPSVPVTREEEPLQHKQAADENEDIHIVFSTGCNLFQHWQAEVLLHSHFKVGQRGRITRVVSGCDTEGEKRLHGKFLTHPQGLGDAPVPLAELQKSSHPSFRLHVTPSFPGAREFPWINKPMGLNHWLLHANPPVTESIIIVLDPDMIFMDRFELDGSRTVRGANGRPFGEDGILMTNGQSGGRAFGEQVLGMTDRVRKGRPVAQTYGLGGQFVHALNASKFAQARASNLTFREAAQYYSVGPPMMAHVEDMRNIFSLWVKYMHPVFDQNPGDIQADMYAYSFAAADFNLPHLMFDHYMVSSPRAGGEAWPMVRKFQGPFSCNAPNRGAHRPDARIPTLLHYAQRYDSVLTDFMFHKGHVAPNIFSCDLPLLITPPDDLIETAPTEKNKDQMYMLCNAYVAINDALLAWKKRFCVSGYNARQGIKLNKKGQRCTREELGKTCWDYARVE